MKFNQTYQRLIISLSLGFSWWGILTNFKPITAIAQNSTNTTPSKILFTPPPVADNGAPGGRQKGAGSHSLCQVAKAEEITPLIALMPETALKNSTRNKVYIWGKTTSAHPTFWFYVAYPVNSYLEFTLQDEAENEVYQTTFKLDKTEGIIGLNLPQDREYLATGKSYHWYLNVMCNPENSTDDFVEGWIERVKLNPMIRSQIESASPLEAISLYAEHGLWYDTLNTVDRLRRDNPKDERSRLVWSDLLQQVGLAEIGREPIVGRYNLEN